MSYQKWPSIPRLGGVDPVLWRSKIKIHGTHAAIDYSNGEMKPYSRSREVTLEEDNCGFAAWVRGAALDLTEDLTIYGEWAGRGIQKGAAVCKLPDRYFFIYTVHKHGLNEYNEEYSEWVIEPNEIAGLVSPHPNVVILPWYSQEFLYAWCYSDFESAVSKTTDEVDKRDPFIFERFGIDGPGEGLVWYQITKSHDERPKMFKSKGKTHEEKVKKERIDHDNHQLVVNFVAPYLTAHRLEKIAFGVNQSNEYSLPLMGSFLQALTRDVLEEAAGEMEAIGVSKKEANKVINRIVKGWYLERAQ